MTPTPKQCTVRRGNQSTLPATFASNLIPPQKNLAIFAWSLPPHARKELKLDPSKMGHIEWGTPGMPSPLRMLNFLITPNPQPAVKGQGGTCTPFMYVCPNGTYWDFLGILGDEKTHKYPRDLGLIFRDFPWRGPTLVARGTSNYPQTACLVSKKSLVFPQDPPLPDPHPI